MSQTNVFRSNKTQAVRLPKPVALPDHVKRVEVIRQGNGRLLLPAGTGWDQFYGTPGIDADFLEQRSQPAPQSRKTWSMISHLLDTDICIIALKKRNNVLLSSLKRHDGRMAISDVTLFELYFGAEGYEDPASRIAIVEDFASRVEMVPFDSGAARHCGTIRHTLEKQGQKIGAYDLMIAATARSKGLTLATRNTREFKRVEGLIVEKWG
jgi:tRNA(fMet)-specific endonuclease VapC